MIKYCDVCESPATYVCGGCKDTWYCSGGCQSYGWVEGCHETECIGGIETDIESLFISESWSDIIGDANKDEIQQQPKKLNLKERTLLFQSSERLEKIMTAAPAIFTYPISDYAKSHKCDEALVEKYVFATEMGVVLLVSEGEGSLEEGDGILDVYGMGNAFDNLTQNECELAKSIISETLVLRNAYRKMLALKKQLETCQRKEESSLALPQPSSPPHTSSSSSSGPGFSSPPPPPSKEKELRLSRKGEEEEEKVKEMETEPPKKEISPIKKPMEEIMPLQLPGKTTPHAEQQPTKEEEEEEEEEDYGPPPPQPKVYSSGITLPPKIIGSEPPTTQWEDIIDKSDSVRYLPPATLEYMFGADITMEFLKRDTKVWLVDRPKRIPSDVKHIFATNVGVIVVIDDYNTIETITNRMQANSNSIVTTVVEQANEIFNKELIERLVSDAERYNGMIIPKGGKFVPYADATALSEREMSDYLGNDIAIVYKDTPIFPITESMNNTPFADVGNEKKYETDYFPTERGLVLVVENKKTDDDKNQEFSIYTKIRSKLSIFDCVLGKALQTRTMELMKENNTTVVRVHSASLETLVFSSAADAAAVASASSTTTSKKVHISKTGNPSLEAKKKQKKAKREKTERKKKDKERKKRKEKHKEKMKTTGEEKHIKRKRKPESPKERESGSKRSRKSAQSQEERAILEIKEIYKGVRHDSDTIVDLLVRPKKSLVPRSLSAIEGASSRYLAQYYKSQFGGNQISTHDLWKLREKYQQDDYLNPHDKTTTFRDWVKNAVSGSSKLPLSFEKDFKKIDTWFSDREVLFDSEEPIVEIAPETGLRYHSGWICDIPGVNPKLSQERLEKRFGASNAYDLVNNARYIEDKNVIEYLKTIIKSDVEQKNPKGEDLDAISAFLVVSGHVSGLRKDK